MLTPHTPPTHKKKNRERDQVVPKPKEMTKAHKNAELANISIFPLMA